MPSELAKKGEGHSDDDTVVQLLNCMHEEGYGDRKKEKKYLADVFDQCIRFAEQRYEIYCSIKGCTKKFKMIRQAGISRIHCKNIEVRISGEEKHLYQIPPFYKHMHKIEGGRRRYAPPAHESTKDLEEKK